MNKFIDKSSIDTAQALSFTSDFHKLSHDLRTPLNHINGFAELLLMRADLSAVCTNYVLAILEGSATLTSVVISFLDDLQVDEAGADIPCRLSSDRKETNINEVFRSWNFQLMAGGLQPESVIAPLDQPLTLEMLPPLGTRRWIARRKAELVAAVDGGLLTSEQICERYNIAKEEFAAWQSGLDRLGMPGLGLARRQKERNSFKSERRKGGHRRNARVQGREPNRSK